MKHSQTPRKWKSINLDTSNASAISQNETYMAELSDHYRVYDYAQIVNLSTSEATLIINHSQEQPLPQGNTIEINRPFIAIAVKNNSATDIDANKILINYKHHSKKDNFTSTAMSFGGWFGALRR